ncbi:autoinducer binding domain-containing protein [Mesorhizobium sp.]|uniref:autoinducer binding domain-containing protein n=1 Tax=Mesorhizobium sp. TaxID=1871066 RepID=UPI0025BB6970|nr:autoinducer binding domain-containing protein [Mesorhizobium sp.]
MVANPKIAGLRDFSIRSEPYLSPPLSVVTDIGHFSATIRFSSQEINGSNNGEGQIRVRVSRTWFQKRSDISSLARTEAILKEALTDAVHELGFDCFAYVKWQQRYLERGYKNIDPVVTTARARLAAFTWAAESPRKISSSRARAFYAEAGDFGSGRAIRSRSGRRLAICPC